jgi:plastocyanin
MPRRPGLALRAATVVSVFAALVAVLAACTNTSSSANRRPHTGSATASVVDGVQQVTIAANDVDRFVPSTIYVHTGRMVKIVLVHTGTGAPHNWQLNGFPAASVPLVTAQGQEASSTFMAPAPGKYEFVCSIHLRQGQTGTLVVLP